MGISLDIGAIQNGGLDVGAAQTAPAVIPTTSTTDGGILIKHA